MSLILCRQEPVRHPFYIERLGVHIASSQELCYVIYQNPLLVLDGFVDDRLIEFIRSELGLSFLAGKLEAWRRSGESQDELPIVILQECCYYTAKEIAAYRQKLAAFRKMNAAEFRKETADYYFRLRQFGTAIYYYNRILEDWRVKSLTDEFTAKIWNNIGAAYAGIFWFEKAFTAYEMAYNFDKSPEMLKHLYQLALIDPKLELKERHAAAMTPEQKKIWKRELDEANRTAEKCGNVRMVETMFDRNPVRRMESAGELLNGWKQEYRKML